MDFKMSSTQEIALAITANEKTAWYAAAKECGHILWEIELGIFHHQKPDVQWAFWLEEESGWDEYIIQIDKPLTNAPYGSITINYETQIIKDNSHYQSLLNMPVQWFLDALKGAVYGYSGYLTQKSIRYHIENHNVFFTDSLNQCIDIAIPDSLKTACEKSCHENFLKEDKGSKIVNVSLKLPEDWKYEKQ
jgi:hypothetical protein